MNQDLTHIEVVIDRSGSMQAIAADVIGGFNAFIAGQKKGEGQATLTYTQFDTKFETLYDAFPLAAVPPLDDRTFVPRGGTALLDAVGERITKCGERLAAMPAAARPGKVLVLIITDGQENSSRKYGHARIKEMIETQERFYRWTFVFIGANQDAFAEGARIGVRAAAALDFVADGAGVAEMFHSVGTAAREFRAAAPAAAEGRPFFTRRPRQTDDEQS